MSTLYEQDYAMWIEDVVQKLRQRDFQHINWENLIEEVADLSGSQRREIRSRLKVLLEHLLKRCYVNLPTCYRQWEITIRDQRDEITYLLQTSPSLKSFLQELITDVYATALGNVREDYPDDRFPDRFPFDLELLLTHSFWRQE